jgi:hypothetical protein
MTAPLACPEAFRQTEGEEIGFDFCAELQANSERQGSAVISSAAEARAARRNHLPSRSMS